MGAGGGELRVYLSLLPMSCPRAFGNRELVRPNRSAYAIDGKLDCIGSLAWLAVLCLFYFPIPTRVAHRILCAHLGSQC